MKTYRRFSSRYSNTSRTQPMRGTIGDAKAESVVKSACAKTLFLGSDSE